MTTETTREADPSERTGIRQVIGVLGRAGGDSRFFALIVLAALIGNVLLVPLAGMATLVVVVVVGLVLSLRQVEFGLVLIVVSAFFVPTRFGLIGFSLVMAAGLLGLGLWMAGRVVSGAPRSRLFGAVDVIALALFVTHLVSYANAAMNSASNRMGAADRQLVLLLAYLGILLFAMEVVTVERQLYWLVNLVLVGASFMALVAILEFFTGVELASQLRPPGFTTPPDDVAASLAVPERFGLSRVFGTAQGTIEFAATLAIALPLAVFSWLSSPTLLMRRIGAVSAMLILVALPLAASRTGVVGVLVGVVVVYAGLSPADRRRLRRRAVPLILVGLLVVPTSVTIFVQVLTNFSDTDQNLGTQGRAGDYSVVRSLVVDNPVLGTGLATFDPSLPRVIDGRRHRTLFIDNQYLSTAVNSGLLGMSAMLAVPVGGFFVARAAARRAQNERLRMLAVCASASIAVSGVTWALYDAFAFRSAMTTAFLVLAVIGALDSVTRSAGRRRREPRRYVPRPTQDAGDSPATAGAES